MANYDHLETRVTQKLLDQQGEINDLTAARDGAYRERAQLLAWLAALHPAVIAPALDLDEPGWWLLYITTPAGQLSWHISPRDAGLLAHVERVEPDDPRAQWDGHTTEEKYQRIHANATATAPIAWCGASTPDLGVGTPMGPCVLRADHDGPIHQAASGAKWWPTDGGVVTAPESMTEQEVQAFRQAWAARQSQSISVINRTPPMRISTQLVDEATADGAGLYEAVVAMFGGPLPGYVPPPKDACPCGGHRPTLQPARTEPNPPPPAPAGANQTPCTCRYQQPPHTGNQHATINQQEQEEGAAP